MKILLNSWGILRNIEEYWGILRNIEEYWGILRLLPILGRVVVNWPPQIAHTRGLSWTSLHLVLRHGGFPGFFPDALGVSVPVYFPPHPSPPPRFHFPSTGIQIPGEISAFQALKLNPPGSFAMLRMRSVKATNPHSIPMQHRRQYQSNIGRINTRRPRNKSSKSDWSVDVSVPSAWTAMYCDFSSPILTKSVRWLQARFNTRGFDGGTPAPDIYRLIRSNPTSAPGSSTLVGRVPCHQAMGAPIADESEVRRWRRADLMRIHLWIRFCNGCGDGSFRRFVRAVAANRWKISRLNSHFSSMDDHVCVCVCVCV